MIDIRKLTNFNRNKKELEEFLIFCLFSAGKSIKKTAQYTNILFASVTRPFEYLENLSSQNLLESTLKVFKTGQYKRYTKAIQQITNSSIDLKNCTLKELSKLYAIGDRTARLFILHTKPNENLAVIDKHILNFFEKNDIDISLIKEQSINNADAYRLSENIILRYCRQLNMKPCDFDQKLWNEYIR